MIRITKMGTKYYGYEVSDIEDDLENITTFVNEGTPVILIESLDDFNDLDLLIDAGDVEMIV